MTNFQFAVLYVLSFGVGMVFWTLLLLMPTFRR